MDMSVRKCCEILGVSPGASAQEVKQAYRDLAKVWHPDRFQDSDRLRERAEEKLKQINDAYEYLKQGVPHEGFDESGSDHSHAEDYPPQPQAQATNCASNEQNNSGCAVAATAAVFLVCYNILPSLLGSNVRRMIDPGSWFTSAKYETVWQTSWILVVCWCITFCGAIYWLVWWHGWDGVWIFLAILCALVFLISL